MLAMNISRMVGIRKLDQDGNHVAGATLQILGHDHETVMKEFVTTDEDFFWAPSAYLNDGSSQYYLHEVSAPGGYLISEEDIPFTFELGETIEYLQIEDVNTRIMKTYKPSVVTVNGKAVEDNIIVMTDKDTDVTISKTDITGTEEIGGASLAVYRAEDILDGEPIEGKEAIDSWTSEEGKSHRIVGKLEAGGEFVLIETTAPDGYEKSENVTFRIAADGSVTVGGETVTDSTVTMVDEYSTHTVKISKTDVGGKEIAGAVLVITGREEGSTEDIEEIRFTTDGKNPHEVQLKPGTYTLTEITAPDGYEKAESITFTVGVDGTVKVDDEDVKGKVTMVDKEKTTKKTTKKTSIKKTKGGGTGDESGVMMVLTVFALAAAGLAATLIRRRRES